MTIQQALSYYLTQSEMHDDNQRDQLITAAKAARRWRDKGPEATATLLHALHEHYDMSYEQIESVTGINNDTAQRLVRKLESGYWGA